jgi:hypothetical protein
VSSALRASAHRLPARTAVVVALGPGQKHQAELADLHLVAVCQHSGIHRLTVDVRAVEAADVDDLELAALEPELSVTAADGDVVEEDIAVGMSAGRGGGLIEQES